MAKQQEASAAVREAQERRRTMEQERLAQLADKQRRKQMLQERLEEERRAAAQAREAQKSQQLAAAAAQRAERQAAAADMAARINGRLGEAAQRRRAGVCMAHGALHCRCMVADPGESAVHCCRYCSSCANVSSATADPSCLLVCHRPNRLRHLELIRERAALGKDFERRDSFSSAALQPGASHCARGAAGGEAPAAGESPARHEAAAGAGAVAGATPPSSLLLHRGSRDVNGASPDVPRPPTPSEASETRATDAQAAAAAARSVSPSPAIPQNARRSSPTLAPAVYGPADAAFQQFLIAGTQSVLPGSVTPAGSARAKMRGVRKRAAKMARRLQATG
jgi:hypothetical protein